MQVVILSAGIGSRLDHLTNAVPKTLVNVNGRPVIDYILETLNHPKISEIIVVGGYQCERLESYLKSTSYPITLVENKEYQSGSILTLLKALDHVSNEFLLMNADHIYPKSIISRVIEEPISWTTAICDHDRILGKDDMKIKVSPSHHVQYISKTLNDYDLGYIGMTKVPKDLIDSYKYWAKTALATQGSAINVEAVLGFAAMRGFQIDTFDVSGSPWFEIDTQEDLAIAENGLASGSVESITF